MDPVIVHVDDSLVTPDKPANPSEILIVYATGAPEAMTEADLS